MRKLILFIMLTNLWYPHVEIGAEEQSESKDSAFWFAVMPFGCGGAKDQRDVTYLSFYSSVSYSWKFFLLTARYRSVYEFNIFGEDDIFWDTGLGLGLIAKGSFVGFSLSAGVGYTNGTYGRYPSRDSMEEWKRKWHYFKATGLTLECQLLVFPSPPGPLGVGLVGFANINPKRFFWGAGPTLLLGVWGF